MTEQEKAALVEWLQKEIALIQSAQDEIPFGLDYDGENTLKVFNIALAALTAEVHSYTFEDDPKPLFTTPPAPAIPDGWRLVPVEPTEEMLWASYREASVYSPGAYRAMIAAAPTP